MIYDDFNTENRNKYVATAIKRNKQNITKNTAKLSGYALAVGVGALGMFFILPEMINQFMSDDAISIKTKFFWELRTGGVGLSVFTSGIGIYGVTKKIKELADDTKRLATNKKKLAELEKAKVL